MEFNGDEIVALLNRLLEKLHQADGNNQGSIVLNIHEKGSLHVDHVDTQNFYGDACTQKKTLPDPPCVGREKGDIDTSTLPASLCTEQAMVLWRKAQQANLVNGDYQPLVSRPQAALLADEMAYRLGIENKWKYFETFWDRRNMSRDYNEALNQKQSLDFRDKLKSIFG